jgi:LPS O-antigen subunit length determinant protein (WzzB/FepE family)
MTNSENDGLNKQATGNEVRGKADIYEDEINLIDCFKVFWRRKYFVILVAFLPALVVGIVFSLTQRL